MSRNTRLVLASAAFVCIAIGAFQPFYWRMFAMDRGAARMALTELPYRRLPGLLRFMTGVRARTRDGERIAVFLPARKWDEGYQYGFTRSTYLLNGRRTVPMIDESDRPLPQNLVQADVVVCFRLDARLPHFRTVWRSADGVLLRRTP
ncbi:MAG TPA: hypothetical protein VGJ81_10225 [Thermoanaerobaculia bacterium]|jgi:hypothetical protein